MKKKKLEAESGAKRLRRTITYTRDDGEKVVKEVIYYQNKDEDKVQLCLSYMQSGTSVMQLVEPSLLTIINLAAELIIFRQQFLMQIPFISIACIGSAA